ncbi:MAG: hypothetical protein M3Q68_06145, partial [Actinomycetota bacterium]|nr:hypothetical protein [Actinomycetota bacterium]
LPVRVSARRCGFSRPGSGLSDRSVSCLPDCRVGDVQSTSALSQDLLTTFNVRTWRDVLGRAGQDLFDVPQ